MANVTYWDAVWYQDIPGGGGRIGLVLTGFGIPSINVNITAYPVGQNDPVVAVENIRTVWDAVYFDLVNVGSLDSVIEGTNMSFSFISQ